MTRESTSPPTSARVTSRLVVGSVPVAVVSDGFLPIWAADMSGEPAHRLRQFLAESFLPPEGDIHTAVNSYVFPSTEGLTLVDAGAGGSLGPDTGHLTENLQVAGVSPDQVDQVLVTHLHPDHAFGLITARGDATFPNAVVRVAQREADYWLSADQAARTTGVQAQIHRWAREALRPYRDAGRFSTFRNGSRPIDGVTAVDLHGHTAGHTGFLVDTGADEKLLLWGDTVHSPAVQLRAPHVTMAIDSDPGTAAGTRKTILDRVVGERWMVGGSHLPFPGLGHIAHRRDEYIWVPAWPSETSRGIMSS